MIGREQGNRTWKRGEHSCGLRKCGVSGGCVRTRAVTNVLSCLDADSCGWQQNKNSMSAQDTDVFPQDTTKLAGWPLQFIYQSTSSSHFEATG